ncbi:MAG: alpha/beta fold hydrolase [Bacteroidales bacterium]|nr:alpha/beta fold hydrolase [Bacteroidales bacterium]
MKLYHRKYGQGPAVIILHGLFGISDNWATIGRRIAEKYEVHMIDLRNHGRSPHSPVFNFPAMVSDLEELIEDLELENIILVGHSLGGKIAMHFALQYPELITKLVVVDISMRHYPAREEHLKMIEAMRSIDFSEFSNRKQIEEVLKEKISNERIRLFVLKNLHRIDRSTFTWRLNVNAIYENIDNVFEGIEYENTTFNKETLFVRAGKSNYIIDDDYSRIFQHFPEAKIQTIEKASHWVHADTPEELCELLNTFLNKK